MTADDRIERTLEAFRMGLTSVQMTLAGLVARVDAWMAADATQRAAAEALRERVDNVEKTTSEHKAEIRRLWWAVGIAMTGAVGATGSALIGGG